MKYENNVIPSSGPDRLMMAYKGLGGTLLEHRAP
jgi:hypothetical protein